MCQCFTAHRSPPTLFWTPANRITGWSNAVAPVAVAKMRQAGEKLLKTIEERHPGLGGEDEEGAEGGEGAEADLNSRRILTTMPQSTFAGAPLGRVLSTVPQWAFAGVPRGRVLSIVPQSAFAGVPRGTVLSTVPQSAFAGAPRCGTQRPNATNPNVCPLRPCYFSPTSLYVICFHL